MRQGLPALWDLTAIVPPCQLPPPAPHSLSSSCPALCSAASTSLGHRLLLCLDYPLRGAWIRAPAGRTLYFVAFRGVGSIWWCAWSVTISKSRN